MAVKQREKLLTKIEKARRIIDANGLGAYGNFNTDFFRRNSFYDGVEASAAEAVDEILRLCTIGVNSPKGFDGDTEKAIKGLSEVVAELATVDNTNTKAIRALTEKKERLMRTVASKKLGEVADVRQNVVRGVTASIDAIDAMLEMNGKNIGGCKIGDTQLTYIRQSREKFKLLLEELDGVTDVTSVSALDHAKRMSAALGTWQYYFIGKMCSPTAVRLIDDMEKILGEWSKLSKSATGKERTKEKDIPKYVENAVDDLAMSRDTLTELDIFREQLQIAEDNIESNEKLINDSCRPDERLTAKLDEIEKRRAALAEKIRPLAAEQKKKPSPQLQSKLTPLLVEYKSLEAKAAQISREISLDVKRKTDKSAALKTTLTGQKEIYRRVKDVYDDITVGTSDPAVVCMLTKQAGLSTLGHLLGGNPSKAVVDAAVENIRDVKIRINTRIKEMAAAVGTLGTEDSTLSRVLDGLGTLDGTLREEQESALKEMTESVSLGASENFDSLLDDFLEQDTAAEQKNDDDEKIIFDNNSDV